MRPWTDTESGNLKLTNAEGLSPVHLRAIRLLLEGDKPLKTIAAELGLTPDAFREMRRKRGFAEEYRRQLARLEVECFDFPIARRVERIAALNTAWLQVREELAKRKSPRVDLTYAMVNLQQAAAKEMGQDIQRVELAGRFEITEQIQVIRFESIERGEEPESDMIEGEFAELPEPERRSDVEFIRAVQAAGLRMESGVARQESRQQYGRR